MKADSFLQFFSQITDPRSHINRIHDLNTVLLIGVVTTLCGAETWKQMEEFAIAKEKVLESFMSLPNGLPSDDTISRVFSAIDPKQFEICFVDWASSLSESFQGQVIAING
jgi:hypothetical protein